MAKNNKEETAIAKKETTAIETFDYGEDAVVAGTGPAKGYENQGQADMAIPFLVVLQSGSPIVEKGEGVYVNGEETTARAGMIMNTVTKQAWENPKGVIFAAGTTRHQYTRFTPRDKGGGFKGLYEIDDPIVKQAIADNKASGADFGEYYVEGDELIETFYVFGAYGTEDGDALGMAIFAFTSSKIKVYKNWMGVIRAHTQIVNGQKVIPPLFAHGTRLTTFLDNKKGKSFFIPVCAPYNGKVESSLLPPRSSLLLMAKACGDLQNRGEAKVNYSQSETGSGSGDSGAPPF